MTDLATLAAELAAAREDLALYERLTSAADRVERLTRDHAEAEVAQDKADAEAAEAALAARFEGLSEVRVEAAPNPRGCGVLGMGFRISWIAPLWNRDANDSLPTRQFTDGFRPLLDRHPEVFDFLVERHPERIPPEIIALAPGEPLKAMATYIRGLNRGYLTA